MKYLTLALLAASFSAHAAIGDIQCEVRDFRVTNNGTEELGKVALKVDAKNSAAISMSAELNGFAYTLSGDLISGDFLLSKVWGEGYTSGRNTTGSFTSTGRLQMSDVDGNHVVKFLCTRVRASDFPRE